MTPTRRIEWLVAAIVVLAGAREAHSNPMDRYGFGSRQIAMGGAATALADDSSANYYNPAGILRGRDLRIDVGYRYAKPWLSMNGRDVVWLNANESDSHVNCEIVKTVSVTTVDDGV